MAEPRPLQFATQAYQARSPVALAEACVNLYPEKNPPQAKSPITLYGTPGLKPFVSVGTGPIRGQQRMVEDLYVVSGNELYVITRAKTSLLLGEIKNAGDVAMATNGTHVVIATSKHFYAANRTGIIALPDEYIKSVAHQDGYVIAALGAPHLGRFIISDLDDATTWTASEFSEADSDSDFGVGLISDHREVWILKQRTTEVWQNVGNADFPFQRAGAGFMERGCAAAASIAKANNLVFWLGDDLRVYAAGGYQPQPVSTPFIDRELQTANSPESSKGFTYEQDGHTFYVLTLPSKTFVYDISQGLWHQRVSDGETRWRANNHQALWNTHIVGDFITGDLYELDLDWFLDKGDTIHRQAIAPPMQNAGRNVIIDELFVDMEGGTGNGSGEYYTVVNYAGLTTDSITITVDGVATAKTEGTDFTAAVSNAETAKRIVAAFQDITNLTVVQNGERVLVIPDDGHNLTLATADSTNLTITASPLGADPKAILDWSDDGGRTFGNRITADIGKEGTHESRVRFHRLGASRQRTTRLRIAAPVKVAITGAYARIRGLAV